MRFRLHTPGARLAAAVATVAVLAGTGIGIARASDHQDNPLVELNPAMDMTDVYAFPGSSPDRIALVLNSWAFLTPAQTPSTTFDPNLLYQFKIDNTGDAKEDKVIQIVVQGHRREPDGRGPRPGRAAGRRRDEQPDRQRDADRHRRDQSGARHRRAAFRCSPARARIRSSSTSSSSSASSPIASRRRDRCPRFPTPQPPGRSRDSQREPAAYVGLHIRRRGNAAAFAWSAKRRPGPDGK